MGLPLLVRAGSTPRDQGATKHPEQSCLLQHEHMYMCMCVGAHMWGYMHVCTCAHVSTHVCRVVYASKEMAVGGFGASP